MSRGFRKKVQLFPNWKQFDPDISGRRKRTPKHIYRRYILGVLHKVKKGTIKGDYGVCYIMITGSRPTGSSG